VGGDREAEQAFAQRYLRPVKAMLLARSRNPDLAADLLQDVMIEALCALRRGQLREPAKLSSFVIAIARNLLNSHYRGAVRRPESLELPDSLPDLSSQKDAVEEMERERLAMSAIASLEPLDRSILQMTLVDGLKPGVIAVRLRLSSDVVRQRKVRATRRVMEFVQRKSQTISFSHSVKGEKI
jgi:RNA polymerase sigma factor (sigma-70 family)